MNQHDVLEPRSNPALVSFVIPVFNESETLPVMLKRLEDLAENMPTRVEWLFVNDGSRDGSEAILLAAARADARVKVLSFARNFGHQAAVTAGVDHAVGEAILIIDADLQDPPELVLTMLERYREGYDVIYGQRIRRGGETLFKRATAAAFYWVMGKFVFAGLPRDTGDFRLLSAPAAAALGSLREGHRFIRGLVAWVGFAQIAVPFERQPRFAGETKYPFRKMLRFAWDAIFSFSTTPMRIATYVGIGVFFGGCLMAVYCLARFLVYRDLLPGWPSMMMVQCIIGGALLLCNGLVGEYCARIYEDVKRRPIYIVRRVVNLQVHGNPERAVVGPAANKTNHQKVA